MLLAPTSGDSACGHANAVAAFKLNTCVAMEGKKTGSVQIDDNTDSYEGKVWEGALDCSGAPKKEVTIPKNTCQPINTQVGTSTTLTPLASSLTSSQRLWVTTRLWRRLLEEGCRARARPCTTTAPPLTPSPSKTLTATHTNKSHAPPRAYLSILAGGLRTTYVISISPTSESLLLQYCFAKRRAKEALIICEKFGEINPGRHSMSFVTRYIYLSYHRIPSCL